MNPQNNTYSLKNLYKYFLEYIRVNLNLTDRDMAKLTIGITLFLFNVFELLLVIALAVFLGVIKETILFSIMFAPLRMLAAGVHCRTGRACIATTLLFYVGSSLISAYCPISSIYCFAVEFICLMVLAKYAPADTESRPIIEKKRRMKIKIKTVSVALLIMFLTAFSHDMTIINCGMFALIIESISILPATYKLFSYKYNNYITYEK